MFKLVLLSLLVFLVGCNHENEVFGTLVEVAPLGSDVVSSITAFVGENSDPIEHIDFGSIFYFHYEFLGKLAGTYIKNLTGSDIDNMYMEMNFIYEFDSWWARAGQWWGRLAQSREELNKGNYLYRFRVMKGGRLLDLSRGDALKKINLGPFETSVDAIEKYTVIAQNYFQRLFWNETLEWRYDPGLPNDHLLFVTNVIGYGEVELIIQRETGLLVSIETFHNKL